MNMRIIKNFALNIAQQTNLMRLAQFPHYEAGNHLIVLAYHRVAEVDDPLSSRLYDDLVSATPRQFDEQMRLLYTCFHPVSADDVLNALNGGRPLPSQAVLVTVDDGYRDFKEAIFPITQKYGIHPVLFVPTAYVGEGVFWWDCLFNAITNTKLTQIDTFLGQFSLQSKETKQQAFDALASHVRMQSFKEALGEIEKLCADITPNDSLSTSYTLDWDELRTLSKAGVTIAPHTHTHPILTHIPIEKARDEIRLSIELIRQQIGQVLPIFAYPDGREHAVNNDLARMLKREGIEMAFTMGDRISRIKQDDLRLFPRITPYPASLSRFHRKLTTYHAV